MHRPVGTAQTIKPSVFRVHFEPHSIRAFDSFYSIPAVALRPDSEFTKQKTALNTDQLLKSVADGNQTAIDELLDLHRERLKRMIEMRMDRRVRTRFDPSDVVQEAMIIAMKRLPEFARDQPMPFYPWVRNIAWEQLVKMHDKHVKAAKRAVHREHHPQPTLSNGSINVLAERLAQVGSGPPEQLIRKEVRRRTREALKTLSPRDREVLELRYLEQLENADIAAVLSITPEAVRTRHFRALQRLHSLLADDSLHSQT